MKKDHTDDQNFNLENSYFCKKNDACCHELFKIYYASCLKLISLLAIKITELSRYLNSECLNVI